MSTQNTRKLKHVTTTISFIKNDMKSHIEARFFFVNLMNLIGRKITEKINLLSNKLVVYLDEKLLQIRN